MKQSEVKSDTCKESSALKQLSRLCSELDKAFPPCTVKEWKRMTKQGVMDFHTVQAKTVLQKELGFSLVLRESTIDRRGLGVFVTNTVHKEKLVGLYPG